MGRVPREDWEGRLRGLSAALQDIARAPDAAALEGLRVRLLGRKGELTELLKALKDLPIEDRRALGPRAQRLKDEASAAIQRRSEEFLRSRTAESIASLRLDLSLPGDRPPRGGLHPLTRAAAEMTAVLSRMGFAPAEGPLVETERYNFEALNIPADHPARDMQDTFYVEGAPGRVMRTHTSPVQIRHLESHRPPVRVMAPGGRVFRHEAVDPSHSIVFHQIEGLYVDRDVSLADLRGTLDLFFRDLFGPKVRTRFRPSYFPFTEPSVEVDLLCVLCRGQGCSACKQAGWLEMLGAGLVHPRVLSGVGLDPAEWSGFAFGIGVERIAMFLLGVPDIRLFYENDLRVWEGLAR